eukprot:TRINITY_DN38672_c0_g1_i2.p1 TRINITY_DN38672_c0_g1~~TRINITY_DN38672_c0_g1_i2.p1  ORF type:complete len:111 (-),score=29.92 TRINITY_DN38672_c0_g1_i2:81-413(-)
METFSHGIQLYCLFSIVSVVFTFAAVPDISRFENMRSRMLQLGDPLNNHQSDNGQVTSPHQPAYPPLQVPKYGKAAQSNDRLAFLRSNKRGQDHNNLATVMARLSWRIGK